MREREGMMDGQLWLPAPELIELPPPIERVAAGTVVVGKHFGGPEWRLLTDADTLDMGDSGKHLLAQLFGSFESGCSEMHLNLYETVRLGFRILDPTGPTADREHAILTRWWRRCIMRPRKVIR